MRGTVAGGYRTVHGAIVFLLFVLIACHGTIETGPRGLVGVLTDQAGEGIAGLEVHSLEAQAVTDAEGRFAVRWKDPETLVRFERNGVRYQRSYQPDDEGTVVEIRLPQTRAVTVHCPPEPCRLGLRWDLGPGFRARWGVACAPGDLPTLGAAPAGTPDLECTATDGAAFVLEDQGSALFVRPTPVPLRVWVDSADQPPPAACQVTHGSVQFDRVADGQGAPAPAPAEARDGQPEASVTLVYLGQVNQSGMLQVVCDGRPAMPARVAYDAGTVEVTWAAIGPDIDVQGAHPAHGQGRFAPDVEEPPWVLAVTPDASGRLALPPLEAGSYRLEWTGRDAPPPMVFHLEQDRADGLLRASLD